MGDGRYVLCMCVYVCREREREAGEGGEQKRRRQEGRGGEGRGGEGRQQLLEKQSKWHNSPLKK